MTSTAPDGSPVELYALLPERGEGEIVARAVRSGGSILELGCGTGRMTRQLVRLGFNVTAVDESAEMLARVEGAETVCARIEGLDLGRRFDAVLLASNLITTEPERRRAFLETCRRHGDLAVVEGLPLAWRPEDGESRLGDVVSRLRVERIDGGVVHGSVAYEAAGHTWTHAFAMRVFADTAELDAALAEVGLRLDRWLDREGGSWLAAVPRAPGPSRATPGVTVRAADRRDLEACARLAVSAAAAGRVARDESFWQAAFARDVDESERHLVVATREAELVGYARAHLLEPGADAAADHVPRGYYLIGLFVLPEHRRAGLGAALTEERLRWIGRRAGEAWFFANAGNTASIALHRRFGFTEVTRRFSFPGLSFAGGEGILFRAELEPDRRGSG